MTEVKLVYSFRKLPFVRQTPKSSGIWGDCRFYLNDETTNCDWFVAYESIYQQEKINCSSENTIFITAEPPSVRKYNPDFLRQFNYVISSHSDIEHPNLLLTQQALPWRVGLKHQNGQTLRNGNDYDELAARGEIRKDKLMSVITSDKTITEGHKERIAFVNLLKDEFGDEVDIFGRGINTFADKWDVMAPYKYHISLENSQYNDYWTEKLSDVFLCRTYPIYYGCPNITDYFSNKSMSVIDIHKPAEAIRTIRKIIQDNTFEKSGNHLKQAQDLVLNKYNFFAMISDFTKNHSKTNGPENEIIEIMPESSFKKKKEGAITRALGFLKGRHKG